jgi:hypothetical protein
LLIDCKDFVGDDKVRDGENGVEIVNCEGFFFANYAGRGVEDFAGNGEIGDDENDIEIADCEKFFINYISRCAVSLHFANLIIVIAAVKTASMYRF